MKRITLFFIFIVILFISISTTPLLASLASKKWPASAEAKKFVRENIVIGMMASPYGTGWTKKEQLLEYYRESREAGPAGLYKNKKGATPKGCYRNITDEEALRAAKSGGYVSPTFTEWMMDGIWPDDITPEQAADMIDYYVKLLGEDHVGLATDDMFDITLVVDFAKKNAAMYNDGGYMIEAFNKGADDCAMLARILPAITDELWRRGYTNEQLAKIYGGNKMRVFQQVWEGAPEGQWDSEYAERVKLRREFMEKYGTR